MFLLDCLRRFRTPRWRRLISVRIWIRSIAEYPGANSTKKFEKKKHMINWNWAAHWISLLGLFGYPITLGGKKPVVISWTRFHKV